MIFRPSLFFAPLISFALLPVSAKTAELTKADIGPTTSVAKTSRAYSLDDVFQQAIERTETSAIETSKLRQAESRTEQARSRYYPQLQAGANVTQQDVPANSSAKATQSLTRVTLSQSIYEGGRDQANVRSSQFLQDAQSKNKSAVEMDLYQQIAQKFFDVLSAEKEVENLRAEMKLIQERVQVLGSRSKIGKSRPVEILTAKSQLAVAESQLLHFQNQLEVARGDLHFLSGLPRDIQLVEGSAAPANLQPIDNYLQRVDRRPDIEALQANLASAQQQTRAAKGGHLPSVTANGNYYPTRTGSQEDNKWDVGLVVTVPIFNGGLVKSHVKESKQKEVELDLILRRTKRDLENRIQSAYQILQSSVQQLRALENAAKLTEQNYRELERDYRFSLVTNLEVLQALASFQEARRSLDRTRYQSLLAWAQLKSATGEIPLPPTPSE